MVDFGHYSQSYRFVTKHASFLPKPYHDKNIICYYPRYANATYFKKTSSYQFRLGFGELRQLKDGKIVHGRRKYTLELRINSDGIPSILFNRNLLVKPNQIVAAMGYLSLFKEILTEKKMRAVFDKHYFNDSKVYYLMRSPRLNDLPVDTKHLVKLFKSQACHDNHDPVEERNRVNRRRRVLYHLKKGDTQKATISYLEGFNFPKAVRMQVLKYPLLSKNHLAKLHEFIGHRDNNIILAILKDCIEEEDDDDDGIYGFDIALRCINFSNHFNYQHLLRNKAVVRDVTRMLQEAGASNNSPVYQQAVLLANDIKDIRQYHDRLIPFMRENVYTVNNDTSIWHEDYLSDYQTYIGEHYAIRPVNTINELITVGNRMGICVASYRNAQHNKRLEIFLAVDIHDNYVACLEVRQNNLVQAKLKYNKQVATNPQMAKDVNAWAKHNKFVISTKDMKV